MTRRWRTLSLGLVLVVGGLAALLLAVPYLLDQERYRGLLTDRASRLLNRNVSARSLRLHLLPGPGATVLGLAVAERDPRPGAFLEAERLDVSLKLLPLLRGELQIKKIRLERPRVRVTQGPDGWNFEDLVKLTARPAVAEPRRPEGGRSAKGQPVLPLLLAGALTLRDGTLLIDRSSPHGGSAPLEIRGLNVDATAPAPPAPLSIHLTGGLPGEASGSFDLTGSIRVEEGEHLPIEAHLKVRELQAAHLASYLTPSGPSSAAFSGTVDLEGKAVGEWPRADLAVDVNLRRVGVTLGKEPGKAPGEEAWLRAKGRWDGEVLDLSEASLRWKGQTLTGRLQLANLRVPTIRFELNIPRLDVESLVPLAAGANPGTPQTDKASVRDWRPVATGRVPAAAGANSSGGLQLEGRLRSGAVHWGGLLLTTAGSELRYAGGLLTLRRLRGGLYGGTLSGDASLVWRKGQPHTSMTARLEGVQTEPLLRALKQERWKLQGIMTLDSKLDVAGPFGEGVLARASGQSNLVVRSGRLSDYPPLDRLTQTLDPLLKGAGSASALNEFDRLSAHWTLDNGVLRTKDLLLEREGAKLLAAGSMNLQDQRLDFDVTARVAKATLEAKLSGTTSDPVVTPQVGRIEQRIKTEVGKILKGERGEALGKVLRQLLPR